MNAGVSITPCPVLSRPQRAFVLLSVALTSNIGRNLGNDRAARKQSIVSAEEQIRFGGFVIGLLLALVFAGAIWQRFKLPLDPIADPDTWGYLSPALRKLTGAEFGHTNRRNFIYPGFVFLVLRIFADFRAITIAQHFLGLLAGAVLLLTWKRARIFVPNPRIGRFAHDLIGIGRGRDFSPAVADDYFRERDSARRHLRVCRQHCFLFSDPICCLFFSAAPAHGHDCICIALAFTAIFLASIKPSFGLASLFVCRQPFRCFGGVVGCGRRSGFLSGSSLAPHCFCCRKTFSVVKMK